MYRDHKTQVPHCLQSEKKGVRHNEKNKKNSQNSDKVRANTEGSRNH